MHARRTNSSAVDFSVGPPSDIMFRCSSLRRRMQPGAQAIGGWMRGTSPGRRSVDHAMAIVKEPPPRSTTLRPRLCKHLATVSR